MCKYAGIIIDNSSIKLDKIFTYSIPEDFYENIEIGLRVKVPFGRGNKLVFGYIIELYNEVEDLGIKIKDIREICDDYPVLRIEDIVLINEMRNKYFSTYIECIKAVLPSGINKGIKNKVCEYISTKNELCGKFNREPYINIYKIIDNNSGIYTRADLVRNFGLSRSSIDTLIKHGFLSKSNVIVNRSKQYKYDNYEPKILNYEQKNAVNKIKKSNNKLFLLHGVTGSGKTEIYLNLVNYMLNNDMDSIVLVPEISLTPQMIERFKGRFGNNIAVFHSRLSEGERYDEWLKVRQGKVKLAVGARSAIFLPFKNLGLIVIDEEHETSYKSDSNPKYDTREIAKIKSNIEGCKVVLGSATPSIETYYNCKINKIDLINLNNRIDGIKMPDVEVVDMRDELVNNNRSIFSRKLYKEIKLRLLNKEQVILFLNRRGFSSFVSCRKCGYVFKCNNCDISLTYHSKGDYLSCHYCGYRQNFIKICPKCKSKYVKQFGVGTEKVEQEVKSLFPDAKVLRMDFDTTRKKDSYYKIYNTFKDGFADILIGTQMIAKGFDFKNVTLVGVIAADLSLNIPDYRASERTFQLLTQVSGRTGRGTKPGNVIIQTYNPDNYSIVDVANYDYDSFFKREINIRKNMNYPPFSNIFLINLSSKNEQLLIKNINKIASFLKENLDINDKINILGPSPCGISKIKEMYRWQIILKGDIDSTLSNKIRFIVYKIIENDYNDIKVSLDINPNSFV